MPQSALEATHGIVAEVVPVKVTTQANRHTRRAVRAKRRHKVKAVFVQSYPRPLT